MASWWDRYKQRFWSTMDMCGPPSWRYLGTTYAYLEAARDSPSSIRAKQVLAAVCHPETGEELPLPFRMSAHVPMNTVLLVGMLSSRSVAGTALWQVANSGFNALQFYYNRSKTNHVSDERLAGSFVCATAAAVAVGYSLRSWELSQVALARGSPSPLVRAVGLFVPFVAAAASKPLQIGIMRSDEVTKGVRVLDASAAGNIGSHSESTKKHDPGAPTPGSLAPMEGVGPSRVCGAAAIGTTIATRVLYLAQPMVLPPLLFAWLDQRSSLWQGLARGGSVARGLHFGLRVGIIGLQSAVATPMCVALFDPVQAMPVSWLEQSVREDVREARRQRARFGHEGNDVPEEASRVESPVYFFRGI